VAVVVAVDDHRLYLNPISIGFELSLQSR
jgi:hypothetical protein